MPASIPSPSQDGILQPTETGDPAADGRLFRRCLGHYATGIAIITAEHDGVRAAVTVNSFASVSLDPPLVLWSLSHTSRSYPLFKAGRGFAVNVLSSAQMGISRHFSSKVEDKFADIPWSPGEFGSPLLHGCLAHFECDNHSHVEGGDHTILLGLVRRASRYEGEPLLFTQGQYGVASSHPEASPAPELTGTSAGDMGTAYQQMIFSQLFKAHHVMSSLFYEHRRDEGISNSVARALISIYDKPGLTIDEVARDAYLGQRDVEDALASLRRRALVANSPDGRLSLTDEGRRLREAMLTRWKAFQDRQVEGIPEADLRATSRTLTRLITQSGFAA
jgi:flavin reductase (DIM6/NTAB) family NADH-FMN oxidoreductase RutF/DNA-binding MarR family transcriptional regulator